VPTLCEMNARGSNPTMQLTASKPDVYGWSACRRKRMLRFMHRGLAAAVDSFMPMNSPFGLPVHVAPLPAGSILLAR
jgi:hypothetical protein